MYLIKNPNKPGEYEVWLVSDNTVYFKLVVDSVVKQEQLCTLDESLSFRDKLSNKGWTISFEETLLKAAHKKGIFNRVEVLSGTTCSCFQCLKTFSPDEINSWVDTKPRPNRGFNPPDQTALCPHCGIDSVLSSECGVELTETFLLAMQAYWFQRPVTNHPGQGFPSLL